MKTERNYKMIFKLITGLIFLLVSQINLAQVISVDQATVSPFNVPMGKTSTVTVKWVLSGAFITVPPSPRVSSTSVQFVTSPGNVVVGSTVKSVSAPAIVSVGGYYADFADTIVIPSSATYKAYKLGATAIKIRRVFTDGEAPSQTFDSDPIKISSSNGAGLSLGRQELYFENGSIRHLVNQDAALYAVTRLSYSGSGLLKGVWEIADPATTSGTPRYRILRTIRQYLPAGGDVKLRSPVLTTRVPGRYLVRFRIQEPVAFDDLSIEYFVGRRPVSEPPVTIKLFEPAGDSVLRKDQTFRWKPDARASAYRLEIYEKGLRNAPELPVDSVTEQDKGEQSPDVLTGAPVAGALVAGNKSHLKLSSLTEGHLKNGHEYWWRILAIGTSGKVISQSPARKIHVP